MWWVRELYRLYFNRFVDSDFEYKISLKLAEVSSSISLNGVLVSNDSDYEIVIDVNIEHTVECKAHEPVTWISEVKPEISFW